jgi:hypothetical protein
MRKWSRILPVLLLVAILSVIFWLMLRPREAEPLYQGKPLTYWLHGFVPGYQPYTNAQPGPTYQEAHAAVEYLGTNAIPTLLRLLRTSDSPLIEGLSSLAQRQHFVRVPYTPPWTLIQEASLGFGALGTNARSAVPQLMQIYDQHPSAISRQIVPSIISQIGPPAESAVPLSCSGYHQHRCVHPQQCRFCTRPNWRPARDGRARIDQMPGGPI